MRPRLCRRQKPCDDRGPLHLLHLCVMHKTHEGVHVCKCGHAWEANT